MKSSTPSSTWKTMLIAAATLAAGAGVGSVEGGRVAATSALGFVHFKRRKSYTPAFAVLPKPSLPSVCKCKIGQQSWANGAGSVGMKRLFAVSSDADEVPSGRRLSESEDNRFATDKDDGHHVMSELNAIKILRAYPRRNGHTDANQSTQSHENKVQACHTALDVLNLLDQSSSMPPAADFTSLSTLSKENLFSVIDPIVDSISSNIAAAALRRLSSPPFLPAPSGSKSRHHKKVSWLNKNNLNDASAVERTVYEHLMKRLLEKLGASMEKQVQVLSSSNEASGENNHKPTLLPHRDSFSIPPTYGKMEESELLNWYALADLLYSLSNLCNVLGGNRNGENIIKGHLLTNISPLQHGSIMNLFDDAIQYISWDDKMTSSFVRCVGPRRLVRDVVRPLVSVDIARKRVHRGGSDELFYSDEDGDDDKQLPSQNCNQLLAIISSYLVLPHSLEKLKATDISTTLFSMTKIYRSHQLNSYAATHEEPLTLQLPQKILLRTFMKRLRKSSLRASAHGRDLTQAVWSVSRLVSYLNKQDQSLQPSYDISQQVLPLPIRLPGEDESDSQSFALKIGEDPIRPLPQKPSSIPMPLIETKKVARHSTDLSTEVLREEAIIMFHTLINDIVHPPYSSKSKGKKVINENNENTKLETLSLGQIADILQAATTLDISQDDIAVSVAKILHHLVSSWRSPVHQCRNCKDIARVLLELQRLRVGSGIFDDTISNELDYGERVSGNISANSGSSGIINESNTPYAHEVESRCVQTLGQRFLDIVQWHKEKSKWACDARTLATIMRSGVLSFPGKSDATEAILDAAKLLILDEDDSEEDGWGPLLSFLSTCNEFEVSNFAMTFAMAKRFDRNVFIALTDQMAEDVILESCTPRSASRGMWSFAMLLSLDDAGVHKGNSDNSFLHERLVDLFHQLCPLLLSPSLSPTDTASAMWAMAKSQYVIDRGIFDQLAQSMATDDMLKRSNTRLVSQALWSCGKMVEFEEPRLMSEVQDGNDEDAGEESKDDTLSNLPPYLKCADKYLRFLIANQAQMTPKHLSQSIWAMGRLQIMEPFLIQEMGDIALHSCTTLNARELANIVWGLMRVDYDEPEIILTLVKCVTNSTRLTEQCTAQEAANLLFSLGKLQIRDKEAFSSLSSILRNQLDEATSQAIANSLWAFEVVNIAPPRELLSTWAQDRLGMAVLGLNTESKSNDW